MSAKDYYRTNRVSEWVPNEMRKFVYSTIFRKFLDVHSVFEFGCAAGQNLNAINRMGVACYGMDINPTEIAKGETAYPDLYLEVGDETKINDYVKEAFDVSFTIGVLDHISELEFYDTLTALEKVTKQGIVICETNDIPKDSIHYYPHDYASQDFKLLKEFRMKDEEKSDGATYGVWWKKC